jgi:hypothetical protein
MKTGNNNLEGLRSASKVYQLVKQIEKENIDVLPQFMGGVVQKYVLDLKQIFEPYHKQYQEEDKAQREAQCAEEGHVGEWIRCTSYAMGWKGKKWYREEKPMRVRTCTRCGLVEQYIVDEPSVSVAGAKKTT